MHSEEQQRPAALTGSVESKATGAPNDPAGGKARGGGDGVQMPAASRAAGVKDTGTDDGPPPMSSADRRDV